MTLMSVTTSCGTGAEACGCVRASSQAMAKALHVSPQLEKNISHNKHIAAVAEYQFEAK